MEFSKYKCPVCGETFKPGDDVVVCPECGAPHHRECYEQLGHCCFEEKHSNNFSFEEYYKENNKEATEDGSAESDFAKCPNCGYENPKATFYCEKCGFPLNEQDRANNTGAAQNTSNPGQGVPFGQNPQQNGNMPPFVAGNIAFDPMAGINPDAPLADDVTAGEMAKFVGKNTPYFMIVFNKIKVFGSSRFNFCAFLFSGAYFLYRKMIGVGIAICAVILAITVGQAAIMLTPSYQNLFSEAYNLVSSGQMYNSFSLTSQFSTQEMLFLYSPLILSILQGIIMLVSGFTANRIYYKHCTKKIRLIKSENVSKDELDSRLEKSGGVNLPLAVCVLVVYMIISYLPSFL